MTSCTVLLLWDATRAALEMTLWPEYFTQGPQQESEKWRKIIKPNSLGQWRTCKKSKDEAKATGKAKAKANAKTEEQKGKAKKRSQMRKQKENTEAKAKGKSKSKAEATAAAPRTTKERTNEESTIFQNIAISRVWSRHSHCRNFTQAS